MNITPRAAATGLGKALSAVAGVARGWLDAIDQSETDESDEQNETRQADWAIRLDKRFAGNAPDILVDRYGKWTLTRFGMQESERRKAILNYYALDESVSPLERTQALFATIAGEFHDYTFLNGMPERMARWEEQITPPATDP